MLTVNLPNTFNRSKTKKTYWMNFLDYLLKFNYENTVRFYPLLLFLRECFFLSQFLLTMVIDDFRENITMCYVNPKLTKARWKYLWTSYYVTLPCHAICSRSCSWLDDSEFMSTCILVVFIQVWPLIARGNKPLYFKLKIYVCLHELCFISS